MTTKRQTWWAVGASLVVVGAMAAHAIAGQRMHREPPLASIRAHGYPATVAPAFTTAFSSQRALVASQTSHNGLLLQPGTPPTARLVWWDRGPRQLAWMIVMHSVVVTVPSGKTHRAAEWVVFISARDGAWLDAGPV